MSLWRGTYTTKLYGVKKEGDGLKRYTAYETFTQPRVWRTIARVYGWYTLKTYPLYKHVDDLDWWLHNRHCNDDCMTGEVHQDGQTRIETYCAHMPYTVRQDLREFDLSTKHGRIHISRKNTDETW